MMLIFVLRGEDVAVRSAGKVYITEAYEIPGKVQVIKNKMPAS